MYSPRADRVYAKYRLFSTAVLDFIEFEYLNAGVLATITVK